MAFQVFLRDHPLPPFNGFANDLLKTRSESYEDLNALSDQVDYESVSISEMPTPETARLYAESTSWFWFIEGAWAWFRFLEKNVPLSEDYRNHPLGMKW